MATSFKKAANAGTPIVETGSFSSPQIITTNVAVPSDNRARIFIKSNAGAVINPSLGNGSNTQELHIEGVSNTDTVELNSTTNLLLSGKIIFKQGTYLLLHWVSSISKWVEVSRNEI